jgi:hypothetical protein
MEVERLFAVLVGDRLGAVLPGEIAHEVGAKAVVLVAQCVDLLQVAKQLGRNASAL